MSTRARPYDPWCDIDGTPILDDSRVSQARVCPALGAHKTWLNQEADVIRRLKSRLLVRFIKDGKERTIHPLAVRVVPLTMGRISVDLRALQRDLLAR